MEIDVSAICRDILEQDPKETELGAALLYACSRTYRRQSAQVGLAVLNMLEEHADRFEKTRLEVVREFAQGNAVIEKTLARFHQPSDPGATDCLEALLGQERTSASLQRRRPSGHSRRPSCRIRSLRELVGMGMDALSRQGPGDRESRDRETDLQPAAD